MRRTVVVEMTMCSEAQRKGAADSSRAGACPLTDEQNSVTRTLRAGTQPFVREAFATLAAQQSSEPLDL